MAKWIRGSTNEETRLPKNALALWQVYRRSDLEQWSTSVDRHLVKLLDEGRLQKLSGGLYYCPKVTDFGVEPPIR